MIVICYGNLKYISIALGKMLQTKRKFWHNYLKKKKEYRRKEDYRNKLINNICLQKLIID